MRSEAAVVTGGAQGIGKGISQALAAAGLRVVMLDEDARAGREAAAEIPGSVFVHGDCSDESDVRAAIRAARAGGLRLKGAVSNAGIFRHGPLRTFRRRDWDRMLAVHLGGAFLLAKHAAPSLARARGAMVLVSSVRAFQSEPGWEAYCACKGGLAGLSQALAVSLAPEVRVNCVQPGWVPTERWQRSDRRRSPQLSAADRKLQPIGRVGTPPDIAALVAFLLSDAAGFITGAEVVIDGGLSRKLPG